MKSLKAFHRFFQLDSKKWRSLGRVHRDTARQQISRRHVLDKAEGIERSETLTFRQIPGSQFVELFTKMVPLKQHRAIRRKRAWQRVRKALA